MGKLYFLSISLGVLLLLGCSNDNKAQAEQLARMQAKLDEQERQNHLLQAQAQEEERRKQHEEELQKAREEMKAEFEAKAREQQATPSQQNQSKSTTQQATKPNGAKVDTAGAKTQSEQKLREKVVRYPATVVTRSGYGELSVRGEPSAKGIQVTTIYDGSEVQVIAETNRCENIGGVSGCWHKVEFDGFRGYMFGGYLQREMISQAEKEALLYANDSSDVY